MTAVRTTVESCMSERDVFEWAVEWNVVQ